MTLSITVVGDRAEGEHQIRAAVAKWGYDWTAVECTLLDRAGQVVETFQWMPMAEAMRRATEANLMCL